MGCGVSSTGRGGNALAITVVPSKPKENNGVAKGPPTVRAEPMVLPPSVAIHATPVDHPRRIIICGAPASGKGTQVNSPFFFYHFRSTSSFILQCELIKAKFGVIHISTGDLLRNAVHCTCVFPLCCTFTLVRDSNDTLSASFWGGRIV